MRKSVKERIKLTALLLCLAVMMVNCRVEVSALENPADDSTIRISDEADFMEFAKKSVDEAYSRGKSFVLTNDLDFRGKEYLPISLMAGSFDGNGHIIKGIKIEAEKSENGFIRKVTESGIVKNLTVSADIYAGRKTENIGGIAGENSGTISSVSFEGKIISYRTSGGIAGHLTASGNIIDCKNRAVILSQRRTGGIAGFSEGTISDSLNYGKINVSSESAHELLSSDAEEFRLNFSKKDFRVLMTGGIAGVNTGIIGNSKNYGEVGYDSLGYLTGGIAGYSKGYIGSCTNYAEVSGRKNTGGIAGLFEPYGRHVYEEDSFDTAEEKADELNALIDEMNGLVQKEDDKTQLNIDVIRAEVDSLRYRISENKAYYRAKDDILEGELEGRLDKIRSTADDMDGDFTLAFSDYEGKSAKEEAQSIANLIRAFIEAIRNRSYPDISENLLNLASRAKKLGSLLDKRINEIKGAGNKLSKKSKKLIDSLEELRDELNELDDFGRSTADSYKADMRNTSDDINQRVENLASEMDLLNEGLKSSDKLVRNKTDEISKLNRELNDAVTDSFDEAKAVIEELKEKEDTEDIFEDLSDDTDETVSSGLIHKCANKANVYGNINTGGIAGSIDYWNETDSESEIVSEGTPSLKYKSIEKATILDSENHADIIASRNYSGGIVGKASSGAVIECGNYGNLFSEEGDYVGGIAGSSSFTIRNCYAVTSVSADAEIGGIAGKGKNLINNRAISKVPEDREHSGAIAGSLEKDGIVSGNEFVSDSGSGINGSSNDEEARKKSYEEMVSENELPEDFKKLTVTFVYEGTVIKRLTTSYNSSLDESEIPELPKKENQLAFWSRTDFDRIRENMLVEAMYEPFISSISTSVSYRDYLLEGVFYPDSSLNVKVEEDAEIPEGLEDYRLVSKISLSVNSAYGTISSDRLIRILDKDKRDIIAVLENGRAIVKETRRDGNYMVADIADASEIYIIRRKWIF